MISVRPVGLLAAINQSNNAKTSPKLRKGQIYWRDLRTETQARFPKEKMTEWGISPKENMTGQGFSQKEK